MGLCERVADILGLNRLFLRTGGPALDSRDGIVISPADCRVKCISSVDSDGRVREKGLFGKSRHLLLGDHLRTSTQAQDFIGGTYFNLYLAPWFLHYLLWPLPGKVLETTHVPGKCYPLIFFRTADVVNEKVVSILETSLDFPVAMILVGSFLVCGIHVESEIGTQYAKGDRFGCFKLGSTVVLIFPPGTIEPLVTEGQRVKLGQALARLPSQRTETAAGAQSSTRQVHLGDR